MKFIASALAVVLCTASFAVACAKCRTGQAIFAPAPATVLSTQVVQQHAFAVVPQVQTFALACPQVVTSSVVAHSACASCQSAVAVSAVPVVSATVIPLDYRLTASSRRAIRKAQRSRSVAVSRTSTVTRARY